MGSDKLNIQNFIDGHFHKCENFICNYEPSTGKAYSKIPKGDAKDVLEAVSAAKRAFKTWSTTPVAERSKLLLKVADILESQSNDFAEAESRDQGKPLWLSKTIDIPRAVLNFRHFANTVLCDSDMAISHADEGILNYTMHSPVGVVGIIVPWNLPLYLLTFKLAPALAYGNTVVVKPSEFTSVTAWMLCSVLNDAGIPKGVVNMVFGYGNEVGEGLVRHSDVPLISFTGSTRTGIHVAGISAKMNKKISLEMGGKNAAIVFDDADLEKCIPSLIKASFLNQGQVCLSTSRIYVQNKIFTTFAMKFVQKTKELKVGDPFEEDTWLGPLCSLEHLQKVRSYVELAKKEGAVFLTDLVELKLPEENREGYYMQPLVLTNLADSSRCMQEEIFGPITCLMPFDSEVDVVDRANGVNYGLCASIWSQDIKRIHSIAPKLEVGTTWCNCWLQRNLHMPFGGMKLSGLSREGTEDSKEFYSTKKTICVKYS